MSNVFVPDATLISNNKAAAVHRAVWTPAQNREGTIFIDTHFLMKTQQKNTCFQVITSVKCHF